MYGLSFPVARAPRLVLALSVGVRRDVGVHELLDVVVIGVNGEGRGCC